MGIPITANLSDEDRIRVDRLISLLEEVVNRKVLVAKVQFEDRSDDIKKFTAL